MRSASCTSPPCGPCCRGPARPASELFLVTREHAATFRAAPGQRLAAPAGGPGAAGPRAGRDLDRHRLAGDARERRPQRPRRGGCPARRARGAPGRARGGTGGRMSAARGPAAMPPPRRAPGAGRRGGGGRGRAGGAAAAGGAARRQRRPRAGGAAHRDGPDRARAAARGLSLQTAGSLVVLGFCGGLDAVSVPGEVIVADEVYAASDEGHAEERVSCALRDELVMRLTGRGLKVRCGRIVCVSRLALGERRAELHAGGAIAVDMESVWLAGAAAERPFGVVRVVLDSPSHELLRPGRRLRGPAGGAGAADASRPPLMTWSRADKVAAQVAVKLRQSARMGAYLARQRLAKRERFPLIVELEPLFQCNLACSGCGKIQHPEHVLRRRMPVEQAVAAVAESGAPMVSIAGGEPLIHPEIHEIAGELVKRKQVRLPVHERPAARAQARELQAQPLLRLGDPHRRPAGAPRRLRRARGRVREGGQRDQGRQGGGLPRHHQHDLLHPRLAQDGARGARLPQRRPRRRRDDDLARLRLRESPRPGALPRRGTDRTRCSARRSPTAGASAGGSTTARCSSTSSKARRNSAAPPGGSRATRCSAGSAPAT